MHPELARQKREKVSQCRAGRGVIGDTWSAKRLDGVVGHVLGAIRQRAEVEIEAVRQIARPHPAVAPGTVGIGQRKVVGRAVGLGNGRHSNVIQAPALVEARGRQVPGEREHHVPARVSECEVQVVHRIHELAAILVAERVDLIGPGHRRILGGTEWPWIGLPGKARIGVIVAERRVQQRHAVSERNAPAVRPRAADSMVAIPGPDNVHVER